MERPIQYLLIFGMLMFGLQDSYAQNQHKKDLNPDDYKRWHQLFTNIISYEGSWISYLHHYESNLDTLFIKNTQSLKSIGFAKGFNPNFLGTTKFIVQQPEEKLTIFDLKRGSSVQLEHVSAYALANNNQYLVVQKMNHDSLSLLIKDINGKLLLEIPHLLQWKMNATHTKVAYIAKEVERYSVRVIDLDKKRRNTALFENENLLGQLEWNTSGTTLAFLRSGNSDVVQQDKGAVFAYNMQSQKLFTLDLNHESPLDHTHKLDNGTTLLISEDGERVFFGLDEIVERPLPDLSLVQVWNTADRSIYPGKIKMNDWRIRPILAVWRPETGKTISITDNNRPFLLVDAKMKYAITYDRLQYEPQFKYHGDRDYYITNLETAERRLFLKAASGEPSDLVASPDGKYMLYYQNFSWWSYELASGKRTNLTKQIKLVNEENDDGNVLGDGLDSRIAGFTMNDTEVLIYGEYDIWKVSTDGTSIVKLTNGRATHTRFRILPVTQKKVQQYIHYGYQAPQYDGGKPLYLQGTNQVTQATGIYIYDKDTKPIILKNKLITDIRLTKDEKKLFYTVQDADLPPQLLCLYLKNFEEKVVHQSNLHYLEYDFGKSELFSFDVLDKAVGGVLLYPAQYDSQKKYPMIVHIYERQTPYLHLYQSPSLLDSAGFNIAHFTTQGYFVCLPNMLFEKANTGAIATKCVNAAVQKIIDRNIVDKDRIGLIGHSYGGYETNFIVTQNNPFKTAVSGASYSDLAADFVHVAWDFKTADYRRFEYGQMRMGTTLFEDPKRYHKNSPLLLAEGVSTPLLLWSGADDKHVDVNHSYKFHMALRRLQKENVLLIYPGEKHTIEQPKNQVDLSIKIKEWFDYYLKDGALKTWMSPNFLTN